MSDPCKEIVQAARYLQADGMSRKQLSALHHFSAKGREVSFASICRYFGAGKNLRANNRRFAERLTFVADARRHGEGLDPLVQEALARWPLE